MKCQIEGCKNKALGSYFFTDGETLREILICKECYDYFYKEVESKNIQLN